MDGWTMSMRELSAAEIDQVAGGNFTWDGFFGHVVSGAVGGALAGAMIGGVGMGTGALAGGLIGGIEYSLGAIVQYCF